MGWLPVKQAMLTPDGKQPFQSPWQALAGGVKRIHETCRWASPSGYFHLGTIARMISSGMHVFQVIVIH